MSTQKNDTAKTGSNAVVTKDNKNVTAKKEQSEDFGFALGKENYLLLAVGFVVIVVGFLLMSGGGTDDPNVFNADELFSFRRTTLAPVVVLFGFIFEIYAIMRKPKTVTE